MLEFETYDGDNEPLIVPVRQDAESLLGPEIAERHLALLHEVQQACTREGVKAELIAPNLKRPGVRIDVSPTIGIQEEIRREVQKLEDTKVSSLLFSRSQDFPRLDDIVFRLTGGIRLTPELFQRAGFFIFEGVHVFPANMPEGDIEGNGCQPLHRDMEYKSDKGFVSLRFTGGAPRLAQTTVGDTDEIICALLTLLSRRPAMVPCILSHQRKMDFFHKNIKPALQQFDVRLEEVKAEPVPDDISALLGSENRRWNEHVLKSLSVLQRRGKLFSAEDFRPYLRRVLGSTDVSDLRVLHELVSGVTHRVSYVPGTWLLLDDGSMHHGRFCSQPDSAVSQSIKFTSFTYAGGRFYLQDGY